MPPETAASVLQEVCTLISRGEKGSASLLIQDRYPFAPQQRSERQYTPRQMTSVFVRDGFIDRYRGTRLVFPATLRLISRLLPDEFPYHRNWKMTEGHVAYWELHPTIDHIHPVARGGTDTNENWVSCSMLTNSIKSNWTLEQLGWRLHPPGDIHSWDGLLGWFVKQVEDDKTILHEPYFKRWYSAALPHVA